MEIYECQRYPIILPYIHINQLKAAIMIQTFEVENTDTYKSFNHEENTSNQDTKRLKPHYVIITSQESSVGLNKWLAATLMN